MNRNTLRSSFLIALLLFGGLQFRSCETTIDKVARHAPTGSIMTGSKGTQTTPAGSPVIYGTKPLSAEQLAAVDAGVKRALDNAKISGYTNERSLVPSFYHVQTPPFECMLSPEQKIPSFLLRADEYDGTEYDQYNPDGKGEHDSRGVIFATEMVLSPGTEPSVPNYGWMYVCSDISVLAEGVNNGAEHILIANNDWAYYWQTEFHGSGGHPLLPHPIATPTPTPASGPSADEIFPEIPARSEVVFETVELKGKTYDTVRSNYLYVEPVK
jgi:hypothetical protein